MKKTRSVLLALLVMALWGSLFPAVKIGYAAFGIQSSRVADILMFAALRFSVCGGIVCLFCLRGRRGKPAPKGKALVNILLIGVFAIVLHYAASYVGLSMTDSSKTALLKQAGVLVYICFSFLFFQDESFSIFKIIGAIVGFGGILCINLNAGSVEFRFGDLLILGASVCTVVSNIISRRSAQSCAPLWITGISQLFGGLVLLAVAFGMGAGLPQFTGKGILVFSYICAASIVSYTLWYHILKTSELSRLFIIKFAEPLFACIFGALLLGENILRWQYLAAFVLISSGIVIGHHKRKAAKHD